MKEYLLLFRGGLDFAKAPQEQVLEVISKWKEWVDNLTRKDIYIGGERLTRNEAVVISGNARQITDGPYTANGEMVGVTLEFGQMICKLRSQLQKTVLFSILTAMLK